MKSSLKLTMLVVAILSLAACTRIAPGSVGVKVNQWGSDKGVMQATECTGTVWYNPIKYDIYEFPTTVQHKEYTGEESFTVNSKDGAEFHCAPIINYAIRPDKVVEVFTAYKKELPELEAGFVKVAVYDAFRIATNSFSSDSLISHREKYEKLVRKLLDSELNEKGFLISQFTSNLEYPATFKKAIESKNAMVQEAQRADNKVKLAQAEAAIAIAEAEGRAKSLLIQAQAEAEANRLKQTSLTPMLVQQQFIDKWNGQLPTYGTVPQIFKDVTNK